MGAQHLNNKIFKLPRHFANSHFIPVCFELALGYQLVVNVRAGRLLEREDAVDNDEEDYGGGEDVHLPTIIIMPFLNLRRHVCFRPFIGLQLLDCFVSCKTEIDNFEVHFVVDQNIFKLEIPMHDSLLVHVFKGVNHLAQKISAGVFTHCSHFFANFKEYSTLDMLHDNVDQVLDFAAGWLED